MGKTHRGQRSRLGTIHHLPAWSKDLLWLLRTIPRNARLTVLSALHSVISIIEREWQDHTPPAAHNVEPSTLKFDN